MENKLEWENFELLIDEKKLLKNLEMSKMFCI